MDHSEAPTSTRATAMELRIDLKAIDGRPRDRRSTPPRMLHWAKGKFGRHRLYRRITSGGTRYHREVQLHKKNDFVQRRCAASMLLQCAL